ncbi:MAG TPA: hypothetical protein VF665_21615 [Longimicrobium sp.]|jgi:hypothetical protein|uniref:hypothetical protein n=1 Tax=Longimicrobium sp. TaxID=2029185 RepID=UPI002ED8BE16
MTHPAPNADSALTARQVEALASALRGGANPFLHEPEMLRVLYGINGFGMNWLAASTGVPDLRDVTLDLVYDALNSRSDAAAILADLGRVLRSETHLTSWLNTEKQRWRHRLVDLLGRACREHAGGAIGERAAEEMVRTIVSESCMVTLDVRGQCVDCLTECLHDLPSLGVEPHLKAVEEIAAHFRPCPERSPALQAVEAHDTIDPHVHFPDRPFLDVLERAASAKAQERAFVFGARLAGALGELRPGGRAESIAALARNGLAALAAVRSGVLSSVPFEAFIQARLPSRASDLSDYVVNRHQVLVDGLTVQELFRWLIAAPENSSSDHRSRRTITAFYRQVLGLGQAANAGLDARPFFIDHGYGPDGEQLDWPSYVFLPAGAIWGKGAGVDLSCGVAFGGGVDLAARRGRDAAYIGGSWSATLYHGHSHVGGTQGSQGAESRDRILHFGLTVDDGARLPWGVYVEAEQHVGGGVYPGVCTWPLGPVR